MNIRNIIKEEINDFDWVGDTEPTTTNKGFVIPLCGSSLVRKVKAKLKDEFGEDFEHFNRDNPINKRHIIFIEPNQTVVYSTRTSGTLFSWGDCWDFDNGAGEWSDYVKLTPEEYINL